MTTYMLNKLQKKYNVLEWWYVQANPFIMEDGRIYCHQNIKDMESLFAEGEGNIVCIYENKDMRGRVRGTVVDKKYKRKK